MRIPIQVLVYPVRKIDKNWEYLMLKRVKNHGGFWQGVTGAPEGRETLLEGAKRELFEETGFNLNSVEMIETDISYIYPMQESWLESYPKDTKEIPEYLFIAIIDQLSSPKIDPIEHNDWKWCLFEDAIKLLSFETNKQALEHVQKLLSEDLIKEKT